MENIKLYFRRGSGREILFEQRESKQNTEKTLTKPWSEITDDSSTKYGRSDIRVVGNIYKSGGENGQVLDPQGISKTIKSGETSTKGNGGIGSSNSPKIVEHGAKTGLYAIGSTQKNAGVMKDCSPSLTKAMGDGGGQIPMVAMPNSNGNVHALDSNYWKGSNNPNKSRRSQVVVPRKRRTEYDLQDQSSTLTSRYRGFPDGDGRPSILEDMRIRRLTPTECERLMGLPDGWTAKGIIDGKEVDISDTQRYKMCGNGVVVDCVDYIYSLLK